jgi:hypothetical protein
VSTDASEPAAEPGLPVLARERDAAVARLRDAYADGQISHEDFGELLDRVLTTTSRATVAAVLEALPAAEDERTTDIQAVMGKIRREGRWQVPRRLRISSEYGEVRLDLTQASFATPEVEIELQLTYGSARVTLPADATLDLDGLTSDWKQPRYDDKHRRDPGRVVRITGHLQYGRLKVRHAPG